MKSRFKDTIWFYDMRYAFRTPTWKALSLSLALITAYYLSLYYLVNNIFDFDFQIPGFVIYSLGYVIAILFYFRLNNSYYRWNDGSKAMAQLRSLNESFVIKATTYLPDDHEAVNFLSVMVKNHYRSLRDLVRGFQNPKNMIEPQPGYSARMEGSQHLATRISNLLAQKINTLYTDGRLTRIQFLDLSRLLHKNTEIVSTCQALQDSPPPKTYIIHIRGFILAYAMMIPFGFVDHFEAWVLLFLVVFFYFYAGLEMVSDEMEDPFGFDTNDIPVTQLTELVEKRIDAITTEKSFR
jgi:ion channel-forming bestrophin family protein